MHEISSNGGVQQIQELGSQQANNPGWSRPIGPPAAIFPLLQWCTSPQMSARQPSAHVLRWFKEKGSLYTFFIKKWCSNLVKHIVLCSIGQMSQCTALFWLFFSRSIEPWGESLLHLELHVLLLFASFCSFAVFCLVPNCFVPSARRLKAFWRLGSAQILSETIQANKLRDSPKQGLRL